MPGSVSTAACLQRAWQSAPSVCRAGLDRKISPNRNRRPNHNPPRCTAALGPQLDEQIDLVENRNCDWIASDHPKSPTTPPDSCKVYIGSSPAPSVTELAKS